MVERTYVLRIVAIAAVALTGITGCGDDGSPGFGDLGLAPEDSAGLGATTDDVPASSEVTDSGGDEAPAGLIVEVAGTEYVVDTERGGHCDVDGDTETGSQISAGGFDAATGTRVDLALRYQTGDTTASGVDEWFGGLTITSSPVQWTTSSTEPWPFEVANPVSATVTMEDDNGQAALVTFQIDCSI